MFTCCSFTFLVVMLQILIFSLTLIHSFTLENGLNDMFFLGIQPYSLQLFGMRMPWLMKKEGQFWRFATPLLLNYGSPTIFINLLLQTVLGFALESNLGSMRMMIFYLICGIGGTLFGTVASPLYAAGPDPAIFGLAAGMLGWFAFYWDSLESVNGCTFGQRLCAFLLLILVVVLIIYLLVSQAAPYQAYAKLFKFAIPDTFAGFGGFLYGFTSILWLLPPENTGRTKCQKIAMYIGVIANIVLTVILVIAFFKSDPKQYWYGDPTDDNDIYHKGLELAPKKKTD